MEQLNNFRLVYEVRALKFNTPLIVTQDMDGYWKAFEHPPEYVNGFFWYRRNDGEYSCTFAHSAVTEVATQQQQLQVVFIEEQPPF